MILMHDKTYRKRLEEIKMLNELYENAQHQLDEILGQKKDLQYQIDYLMFSAKSKQKRINKAIEYIEEKYEYILKDDTFLDHDERVDRKQMLNLLDILKGSDSNE